MLGTSLLRMAPGPRLVSHGATLEDIPLRVEWGVPYAMCTRGIRSPNQVVVGQSHSSFVLAFNQRIVRLGTSNQDYG